jgi:hypothetical protein
MLRLIQKGGRWLFQRADGVFNRAFGDHLNPLYHLGSLTWWLFWIVVASGLYLYVFFRTGVEEAYASVERLTFDQWWLGGIMRSVHRYASDALALTMLLHFTRHFVFDHHRGYRWFSWVTGVVLLVLVYASSVNGYMLPWDRLAQFVVIATAEWLDWLPLFDGALVRNFIAQGALSDRLWSLLSFVHVGLPLSVLALMWVHTHAAAAPGDDPGHCDARGARPREAGGERARPRRSRLRGRLDRPRLVLSERVRAALRVGRRPALGGRRRRRPRLPDRAVAAAETRARGRVSHARPSR